MVDTSYFISRAIPLAKDATSGNSKAKNRQTLMKHTFVVV